MMHKVAALRVDMYMTLRMSHLQMRLALNDGIHVRMEGRRAMSDHWKEDGAERRLHERNVQLEAENKRLREERKWAIVELRGLCKEVGDNDWEDELYIPDIIEKHLADHLLENGGWLQKLRKAGDALASDLDKLIFVLTYEGYNKHILNEMKEHHTNWLEARGE